MEPARGCRSVRAGSDPVGELATGVIRRMLWKETAKQAEARFYATLEETALAA